MTTDALRSYTLKDLAQMAKRRGLNGWQSMRKDQLVKALAKKRARAAAPVAKSSAAMRKSASKPVVSRGKTVAVRATRGKVIAAKSVAVSRTRPASNGKKPHTNGQAVANGRSAHVKLSRSAPVKQLSRPKVLQLLEQDRAKSERRKNLASANTAESAVEFRKDRLVALVRDPFWLHAYWELTRQSVQRAQAAMGQDWHSARPVLRLLEVADSSTTSASETVLRDIEIHGGVNNWYVHVQDPPKSYRLDVGYLANSGKFYALARSNVVTTPRAGAADAIDENWTDVAENFDKIFAMSCGSSPTGPSQELQEIFEERLRRPMSSTVIASSGESLIQHRRDGFGFELDAELIVYGSTEPGARVTLQGDPVRLRPDGTFTVRFSLPNCRQVIPAVAISADGIEQQTVVLAVERNTKTMEPLVRDGND